MDKFVTDNDVLNNISDDIIYFRELVENEKKRGLNVLKEAHLGRLAIVLSYNSIEAHRDFIARSIGITQKTVNWNDFFNSDLNKFMKLMIQNKTVNFNDLDEVKRILIGLKSLRDFISHGLIDRSAQDFDKKIQKLKDSGLLINPSKLTITDVDRTLVFVQEVTNLIGMSNALFTSSKSQR